MENTDLINDLDLYWQVNTPNFLGILKGYDLSKFDGNLIEILISKKVYVKEEKWKYFDESEEYDQSREQYNAFGWTIARKPHNYYFNPLIIKETFLLIRKHVEYMGYITEDFVDELAFKVGSKFDKKSKKKYLKKQYEKYFPEDLEFSSFSTLADNSKKVYGVHQAWYEKFSELVGSEPESFLGLYVTNSQDNLNWENLIGDIVELTKNFDCEFSDFIRQWKIFFKQESILIEILYLLEKIDDDKQVLGDEVDSYENQKKSVVNSNDDLSKNDLSALETAYYYFYMREAKEPKFQTYSNVEEVYKSLSKEFGANWKNIQKSYNPILQNKDLRLKKGRDKKIEKVIPYLTHKAKDLAKIELNMAKNNS